MNLVRFWERWTVHEKQDTLWSLSPIAIFLILILLRSQGVKLPGSIKFLSYFWWIGMMSLPQFIRRRKQFNRIQEIKEELAIPIEEMREAIGVGRYDLMDWKKGEVYLQPRQWYLLEEYMEKRSLEASK